MHRKVINELNGLLMGPIIDKYAANGKFLTDAEYKLAYGEINNIKHLLSRVEQVR